MKTSGHMKWCSKLLHLGQIILVLKNGPILQFARSGSTIKMFINGEEVDSALIILISDPPDITIGDRYVNSNATQYFDGFISNVRHYQRNRTLYIRLHTTNSTTHKCNQHKTSVLSVKYFCDLAAVSVQMLPTGYTYWMELYGVVVLQHKFYKCCAANFGTINKWI